MLRWGARQRGLVLELACMTMTIHDVDHDCISIWCPCFVAPKVLWSVVSVGFVTTTQGPSLASRSPQWPPSLPIGRLGISHRIVCLRSLLRLDARRTSSPRFMRASMTVKWVRRSANSNRATWAGLPPASRHRLPHGHRLPGRHSWKVAAHAAAL